MRRSPDRREFCCDDDDWATWHPSSLRWARMQRLIGGVGQGEAKDSFLRVVWNPGEDMVSSGGIAAAPTAPAAGAWCGFCFAVSQSSREDRGRDIVIFSGQGQEGSVNMDILHM